MLTLLKLAKRESFKMLSESVVMNFAILSTSDINSTSSLKGSKKEEMVKNIKHRRAVVCRVATRIK